MEKPESLSPLKWVFFIGILLEMIWLSVTLISLGLPEGVCQSLAGILPAFLGPEVLKMQNGFYYQIRNIEMPSLIFLGLFSAAFFLFFYAAQKILKGKTAHEWKLILFFAILFRITLLPSVLIHENDIYRYLWDGKVTVGGTNPYQFAPQAAAEPEGNQSLKKLREENKTYFDRISYRWAPTIYPPVSQAVFAFSQLIKKDSIITLKTVFVFFEIALLFILVGLLGLSKMNPNRVLIYAWCPLPLKEFANSGHLDPIPIFFTFLAIFLFFSKKQIAAIGSLIFGVLSKFFPLIFAPFFVKKAGRKSLIFGTLLATGIYLPFFLWGGLGVAEIFKGLFIFSEKWAINGGIFELIRSVLNIFSWPEGISTKLVAKFFVSILFVGFFAFIYFQKRENNQTFLRHLFLTVAALFLLSPVGDPWYFCWVIPFLCFFPSKSLLFLSWLLIFSYLDFTRDLGSFVLGDFKISRLILIQYVPFYVFLGFEYVSRQKNIHHHSSAE